MRLRLFLALYGFLFSSLLRGGHGVKVANCRNFVCSIDMHGATIIAFPWFDMHRDAKYCFSSGLIHFAVEAFDKGH